MSYGATLVLAIAGPGWIGLAQIGDGDALVVGRDGGTRAPVPGDERLVGGETTSLCLPTAERDARYAVILGSEPALVLLATDGYGNSFAASDWRSESGSGFAELIRTTGPDVIEARLPEWLRESAEVGGDDVTMAVLVQEEQDPATLPQPPRTAATSSAAAAPNGGRRSRRGGKLLLVGLVGLTVGALSGWAAGSVGDEPDRAPAAATVMSSTTTSLTPPPEDVAVPTTLPTPEAAFVVAPGGRVVGFTPLLDAPAPVVVSEQSSLQPAAAVWWADAEWSIDAQSTARLVRTGHDGTTSFVDLPGGPAPGGLAVASGGLWVIASDGTSLIALNGFAVPHGAWVPVQPREEER